MKNRRLIAVGLTFIAGLYFILDFIVPPTMPGLSYQGVVLSTTPATFQAQSPGSAAISYSLEGSPSTRPQIMVPQRDSVGGAQLSATTLREISRGSKVTIRIGPFKIARVTPTEVDTDDGTVLRISTARIWSGKLATKRFSNNPTRLSHRFLTARSTWSRKARELSTDWAVSR